MGLESKIIGDIGEDTACDHVHSLGWRIIERNFRSSHGEIDIVARDGESLVFVEVKSYSFRSYSKPVFSISKYKKRCIIHAARTYLKFHNIKNTYCRFDVVAIYRDRNGEEKLEHFKNAFQIN